jgi:hypothetical protein
MKHLYSFKAFGDQRDAKKKKNVFDTTWRSTLSNDTAHYRGKMEPYNVKHALIDPSHTFTHPTYHHTRRDFDLMGYDKKNGRDKTCKNLQHIRRETFDFNGTMILRLPERRDLDVGVKEDPVGDYYNTRKSN